VELWFEEKGTSLSTLVLAGTARGTARDLRSVASLGVFSVAFSAQGGSGAADLQGGASTLPTPNAYLYVSGRVTVDGALGHGTCAQAFLAIRNPETCGADQTPC